MEAIVDFRANATQPLEQVASRLAKELTPRYAAPEEMRMYQGTWTLQPGQPPIHGGGDKGFQGYRVTSTDGTEIAQFRVDGFTYNRLPPYSDGEAIIGEALRLWPLYVEIAAPGSVKRLALRYVNQFPGLPLDGFREILAVPPEQPPGAPGPIEAFLTQMVTADRSTRMGATTTRRLARALDETYVLVLDIDVWFLGDFETDPVALGAGLGRLRELKNQVFFGSITESAAAKCEGP